MKPSPQFRVQSSLGFLLLASVVAVASGQAPADRVGPLAALRAGMPVTLRETGGRFEIRVHEGLPGPRGHAVVRVGPDYVVVKNIAEVVEQWIPISAISSVTVMKISKLGHRDGCLLGRFRNPEPSYRRVAEAQDGHTQAGH